MARVTDQEVKAIIDTERDTTPFIETAHLLVNEELADKGMSDERLTQIEKYLSAHYTAVTEERGFLAQTKTVDSVEEYGFNEDMMIGLTLTRYGQQAISLDTSGRLQQLSGGVASGVAKFEVY